MTIKREWSMPSRYTFSIRPIADLLTEEVGEGLWVDPFAGRCRIAEVTNDFNTAFDTSYNLESLDFLALFGDRSVDGVLFDPPYSVRQIKECYESVGLKVLSETTRSDWWTKRKQAIARVAKDGGKVISFGWNSNGIGRSLGFRKEKILLVAHGGVHNDTIGVVEIKSA